MHRPCQGQGGKRFVGSEPRGHYGVGRHGGVRAVHYNRIADGAICLLPIYSKGVRDNIEATLAIAARRPDVLREVFE